VVNRIRFIVLAVLLIQCSESQAVPPGSVRDLISIVKTGNVQKLAESFAIEVVFSHVDESGWFLKSKGYGGFSEHRGFLYDLFFNDEAVHKSLGEEFVSYRTAFQRAKYIFYCLEACKENQTEHIVADYGEVRYAIFIQEDRSNHFIIRGVDIGAAVSSLEKTHAMIENDVAK